MRDSAFFNMQMMLSAKSGINNYFTCHGKLVPILLELPASSPLTSQTFLKDAIGLQDASTRVTQLVVYNQWWVDRNCDYKV